MKAKPAPPQRFIYVIGPDYGWQKIGIATDPKARLATLQTASPNRLRLHASIAVSFGAAHGVEARAHAALRPWAATGEWFAVTPAEAVAAVMVAAGDAAMTDQGVLPLFSLAGQPPASNRPSPPNRWFGQVWRAVSRGGILAKFG